mgnify:CR=1 FL=1
MAKIKLPTKSPHIDMTPMVDLFSLLLTFFMLTTTFRPSEVAPIDMPFSVSEKPKPDANIMVVLVSKDGRVFFDLDNGPDTLLMFRSKVLQEMGTRYNITFTPEELRKFGKLASFGMPVSNIKAWIAAKEPKEKEALNTGIPMDSTDNQLEMWILFTRKVNPNVQACIKGDADADFKQVKKVLDILQGKNVNRFNLITNLDAKVEVKLEQ